MRGLQQPEENNQAWYQVWCQHPQSKNQGTQAVMQPKMKLRVGTKQWELKRRRQNSTYLAVQSVFLRQRKLDKFRQFVHQILKASEQNHHIRGEVGGVLNLHLTLRAGLFKALCNTSHLLWRLRPPQSPYRELCTLHKHKVSGATYRTFMVRAAGKRCRWTL